MSVQRDLDKFYRELRKAGFSVTDTRGGHVRITHPDFPDKIVHGAGSASDYRSFKNTKADVRRDFNYPQRQQKQAKRQTKTNKKGT